MCIKKLIYLLFILLINGTLNPANAQDVPSIFQNYFSPQFINPATTGDSLHPNISMIGRLETNNVENRNSYYVSYQDTAFNSNVGVGVNLEYTSFWWEELWKASLAYSHKFSLPQDNFIKVGIQTGIIHYSVSLTEAEFHDDIYDPAFAEDINNLILPIGFGIHADFGNFWVGISSPDIITINIRKSYHDTNYNKIQFCIDGGYNIPLTNQFMLTPVILAYQIENMGDLDWETSMVLQWKDHVWLGGGYDSNETISAFTNWKTKYGIAFGYSASFFKDSAFTDNRMIHSFSLSYWFG